MAVYDVTGADRVTGQEKTIKLAATSKQHAEELANRKGLAVSTVDEAVAKSEPAADKTPKYRGLSLMALGFEWLSFLAVIGAVCEFAFFRDNVFILIIIPTDLAIGFVFFGLAMCCREIRALMRERSKGIKSPAMSNSLQSI